MRSSEILEQINALPRQNVRIMEVCGTHTMSIAEAGIKRLLPEGVKLLSGPGCPVCVTPPEVMDAVLELSGKPGVTLATYGDMIRVPGGRRGDNLARRRALGASIEVVYSPMDALEYAINHPEREVVFLGVGFETTAPGTAVAVLSAAERDVKNFSVFSMLKRVEPALRALVGLEDFAVDGFLCPGHVAVITGAESFRFLPDEYGLAAVVGGFEPEEILIALYELLGMLSKAEPGLSNCYPDAVSAHGNDLALDVLQRAFVPAKDIWRGLGEIEDSGLELAPDLSHYDARRRFEIEIPPSVPSACRCGDVICGRLEPKQCPLFGTACTPEDPFGPCMVSSEGACAAEYKYQGI